MKKIFLALAAVAMSFAAQAVEYDYSVFVNQKNGENVEYKFEDEPVASFDGENLVMNVIEQHISYPMADIVNLTIGKTEKESGVADVKADMTVFVSRDAVTIAGLEEGETVAVYDMAGMAVVGGKTDAAGNFSASLSELPKGVYIVKAGKNSFKFIR